MFSPYHTSGFYYAPITKVVLCSMVASTFAVSFPLVHYRRLFHSIAPETIFEKHNIVRYLTCRLVFTDPKTLLCAGILLYHFRIFERRYGSLKFCSYLLATSVMSLFLELLVLFASVQMKFKLDPFPSGPHGLVFALFVPYFCDLPRVAIANFMSIPVTGKSLTYLLGLQMSSDSLESTILAICGIVSGLIYRHNVLWLQSVLSVPTCIGRGFHTTVGGMLYSSPPQEASRPIGATLEIQRSQRMEELEQQIAIRQINQHRHANPGAGIFGNLPLQQNVAAANQQPGIFGNLPLQPNVAAANHQQQQPEPGEELVQTLVDMGFGRDSAMQALRATNNDLSLATNVLLHQQ